MKVYNYHPVTKEYLGESDATESPLEPEVFLIPANAVETPPPVPQSGFTIVWNEQSKTWVEKEDHRGKTVYNISTKEETIIDYIGPIKAEFTEIQPQPNNIWDVTTNSWIIDINALKTEKQSEIKTAFSTAMSSGFTCSNGIKMDAALSSVLRLKGGYDLCLESGVTTMNIRDFDNVVHTDIPVEEIRTMLIELGANYQTILGKKWLLEDQINKATTATEIEAITW